MKIKIFTILLLLFLGSSAWSYEDSLLDLSNPYLKVVKKYTRSAANYGMRNLDAEYIVYATYQSQEFRKAFTELYNKLYPHGQEALANKLGHPWEGKEPQVEFFVGVYAKEKGLQKISGPKNLWNLTLILGKDTYQPALIEEVKLTPFEYKFYPYLNPWSQGFHVVFPVSLVQASTFSPKLQMSSVAGHNELKFK